VAVAVPAFGAVLPAFPVVPSVVVASLVAAAVSDAVAVESVGVAGASSLVVVVGRSVRVWRACPGVVLTVDRVVERRRRSYGGTRRGEGDYSCPRTRGIRLCSAVI